MWWHELCAYQFCQEFRGPTSKFNHPIIFFASICQFYYCSINSLGIFSKFDPLLVEMSISGADWVPLEEPSPRPRMLYTGWRSLKPSNRTGITGQNWTKEHDSRRAKTTGSKHLKFGFEMMEIPKDLKSSCGGQGSVGLRVGLNMFLFRRWKSIDESHRGP